MTTPIVTELPRALEPVTTDPFIERRPAVAQPCRPTDPALPRS
jgi:hypothetical protein